MFLGLMVVFSKEISVFFKSYNYNILSFLVSVFKEYIIEQILKNFKDEFKFILIFCCELLFLLKMDNKYYQGLEGVSRLVVFFVIELSIEWSIFFFLVYGRESSDVLDSEMLYVNNFVNCSFG